MANIMVNETCDLRCPYCFAGEFVNKAPKEMSLGDFETALEFALSSEGERQVGIIGGEPLLYTHINEAMNSALTDTRTDIVMLYTNAVQLENLSPDMLEHKKFRMLVNCNSPEDMGEEAFAKMRQSLRRFKNGHSGEGRFRLSVNLYKPDFDHSYIFPILDEIDFDVIRLSISVPPKGDLKGKTPLEYFVEMKPVAIRFIGDMIRCGVITGFDCNFFPECVFTKDERDGLRAAKEVLGKAVSHRYSRMFWERVIFCEVNNCSPVIDILPDLRAIRCFGLSEYTKQDIRDFRNIEELRKHYLYTVDQPACNISTSDVCDECYNRELARCSCGCLLFKADGLFG
ncbi:MAG: radical SAM protein [Oscillospiraceae bacterium]|nr:radical SAM protein [Oscillospiraceae bacterium]